MKRETCEKENKFGLCPFVTAQQLLSGRWAILILETLSLICVITAVLCLLGSLLFRSAYTEQEPAPLPTLLLFAYVLYYKELISHLGDRVAGSKWGVAGESA